MGNQASQAEPTRRSGGYIRLWVKVPVSCLAEIQSAAAGFGVEMMAAPTTVQDTARITYAADTDEAVDAFDRWLCRFLQNTQTVHRQNRGLWQRLFGG